DGVPWGSYGAMALGRREFGKGNRASLQTVLHSQVGEAPNHDRVGAAGGASCLGALRARDHGHVSA
ncbi:MAG: hypothetical protein ACKPKO_27980, partial [Candidatus Fonsibacter sp.]